MRGVRRAMANQGKTLEKVNKKKETVKRAPCGRSSEAVTHALRRMYFLYHDCMAVVLCFATFDYGSEFTAGVAYLSCQARCRCHQS